MAPVSLNLNQYKFQFNEIDGAAFESLLQLDISEEKAFTILNEVRERDAEKLQFEVLGNPILKEGNEFNQEIVNRFSEIFGPINVGVIQQAWMMGVSLRLFLGERIK